MAEQRVTFMTYPGHPKKEELICESDTPEILDAIKNDKPIPVSQSQADLIDMHTRQMLRAME